MKCGTQHGRFFVAVACLALCSVPLQATMARVGQDGAADFDETNFGDSPGLTAAAGDIGISEFRSLTPIYRFWSPLTSKHFYTIDVAERDKLVNEYPPAVWTYEGVAYYTYARETEPGLMPVYRFWSPVTSGHFYTIDEAERDKLINEYAGVWIPEGTAFYAYPPGGQPAQANAVYRFWSPVTSGHFYTIDEAERDKLINEYAGVWIPEDVAWYAYIDPNVVEPTPVEPEVFEFSGGDESASCTLTLKAYINGVEATIDNPRLTFVPQTGYMRMSVDFGAMTTMIEEVLIESKSATHTTTIRGGAQGQVAIPMTLTSSMIFWAVTPRGPYGINPLNLRFPVTGKAWTGDNETFTLTGSLTLDGSKFTVGQALRATRFTDGQGEFDDAGLPTQLDVGMIQPFVWVRSQHEDRLIQTTVRGNPLQLYITSAQVRTTGVWEGTPSQ